MNNNDIKLNKVSLEEMDNLLELNHEELKEVSGGRYTDPVSSVTGGECNAEQN